MLDRFPCVYNVYSIIYNVFVLNHECYLIGKPKTVNHGHNTRNNKALHLPKPNTNYLKRTVTYRGIQLWNSIISLLPEFDSNSALRLDYGGLGLVWQNCYISVIYRGICTCYISNER